jgi:hypothetical protein
MDGRGWMDRDGWTGIDSLYILVLPPRWQNSRLPPTCRREMGRVGGNASFRLIFRRFGCNPCDGDFGTLKAKIHTLNEEINLSA